MSRMNRCEDGTVSARQRHAHPRLYDAVAFRHSTDSIVVVSAVQRMRDRSNQQLRRVTRQHRVRVESDYVADVFQSARVADDGGERILRTSAHELVELRQLPALSLPSHPDVLLRIPQPRTMEKEKH